MRIRTFNDPVLRRRADPVRRVGSATRRLAARMVRTMRAHRGVGLAAPQVGVLSRLIVVDVGQGLWVIANPRIAASSGAVTDWEGCLSFPGLLAEVTRAERVSVEGVGLDGRKLWVEGEGFFARALQHEIDHLDGVVILDRALSVERAEPPEEPGPAAGDPDDRDTPGTTRPLRVAFLGTPDFACPTLEALIAAGHEVVGVVTQPDRPAGRGGRSLRPPSVKQTARAFGLPVWQGGAAEARRSLAGLFREWRADVAVVVAYGVILPTDALRAPRFGCLNLHASLLPEYRGAAPIQRAILDGRTETGVTVIRMDEGVDTGDILAQRAVPILPRDTAGSLHDRLAVAGADLMVETLELVASGRAQPRPQPVGGTSAPRLAPEDEVIDWSRPVDAIERQVRALYPAPGAHTCLGGRRLKVWWVQSVGSGRVAPDRAAGARYGEVVAVDPRGPLVRARDGLLLLEVVQPAGGARMSGADFVNGYRVKPGDRFG
ncbi:MAG: methionyl-tRNA formyltransferase [Actinomycetia bacterium]|nr:methionyl-tRNA formyltransferase [Actinomycetes bacterium]